MPESPVAIQMPPGPDEPFDIDVNEESFQRIAELFETYGGICKLTPRSRKAPTYIVNHPDYIKRVLVTNYRNYAKGIGFERVKMLLGNGIIVSDGEHWRKQRRMMQPAFHRQIVEQLSETIRQCNLELFEKWEVKVRQREKIDITETTSELGLEIILRTIFSKDLATIISKCGGNPFSMLVHDTGRDLQLVVKFRSLTRLVAEIIELRRREGRSELDFLSLFMEARDKETGEAMADRDLIDEVMTLIVAGHETTAATMNWAWYLLSQNPQAEEKLHREVDSRSHDGVPSIEEAETMTYTRQVMDETLRLYPPVWLFTRKALGDDRLGDYDVAAGTDIVMSPYIVHRHPDYWEEPEAFMPERFEEEAVRERHRYAYFPFSMGARRCVGEYFTTIEIQTHLGLMARHFRLRYVPDRPVELEPLVNLRTKHSIFMQPERR